MPTKQSAKKYMRVTATNTRANNAVKKEFKNATKKVLELVKQDKFDEAKKAFLTAQKALDKAAKKGVIKRNTAARKKSRLAKKLNK